MRKYLKKLPKESRELIKLAADIARRHGMPAYLVGGCVRDMFLGKDNFDLDIVIVGDAVKIAEDFASAKKAKVIRHRRFATATVLFPGRHKMDFATARKEVYPAAAHLPVVEPGGIKDDLFRRDFTLNAMAVSLNREDFGVLIDHYGGLNDLRAKKIRVLHGLSFVDDPTRILRAVRFEQRFGFKIEPLTLSLIREAVKHKMLHKLEPQRLRDELILLLKEKYPVRHIRRFNQLAGFSYLDRSLEVTNKVIVFINQIDREEKRFARIHFRHRHLDRWVMFFSGLTAGLTPVKLRALCRKLALRSGEEARIVTCKLWGKKIARRLSEKDLRPSQIFKLLEPLSYETILLIKAGYANKILNRHVDDFFRHYTGTRISVGGEDLVKSGIKPGPHYSAILNKVLEAKLDGLVKGRPEELVFLRILSTKKRSKSNVKTR